MGSLPEDVECLHFGDEQGTHLKPLDADEFRQNAHRMVDFIADYYKRIENFPVRSQVQPGFLRALLPDSAPEHPETFDAVLDDVEKKIMPGVTHWLSPSFFAYFASTSSTASFLGEMLSSGLCTLGFSWITCPAATELETITMDWLAKLVGLPRAFLSSGKGGGVIQGTASEAILVALVVARNKALKRISTKCFEKLVVYGSDQTHSSLLKACMIAGIHKENCRALPTDASTNYSLSPNVIQKAILNDIGVGLHPLFICATIGTTSSTAVDPLSEIGKIAQDYDIWLHVDAAYGGSACICPEYRHYIDGVGSADSFNMNLHKWLLVNFDFSPLWIKDSKALVESFSTNPEYLRNKDSESKLVIDYKDWQIPLGSRFRSLKLWMVLRLYGVSNLQAYIRSHIKLAKNFEQLVREDARFEVVTPRTFSMVCFRLRPPPNDPDNGYTLNSKLLETINNTGKIYLSHAVLSGMYTLRFAIGGPLTEEQHVNAAWKLLEDQALILLNENALFN